MRYIASMMTVSGSSGQSLPQKVDRDGKVMLTAGQRFAWLAAGLSVNESDGSVWVVEHDHPQVAGSKSRVLIFEPDGKVRRTIDLMARGVVVDAARGHAWISGTPDGLTEVTLAGDVIKSIAYGGSRKRGGG